MGIPYRNKTEPIRAILVDNSPVGYGGGVIQLETTPALLEIAGILEIRSISIIDLRQEDIIVGYNWLKKYNPDID